MKVSVLLKTYNHEKWIAQAINSALMQKTNFDYEVVIMEDCSTDHTRDIVIDFQRRYPDKIRLILSEKNKCDNTNWIAAWQTSPSQYVAWLDGDDYWTSPYKLQRQVDFLDTHPDYAISYHNVTIAYEDRSHEPWFHERAAFKKETSTLEDLLARNFIPGCSPMLRKGLLTEFPDWFYNQNYTDDWAIYSLLAQHGKIGYIDEVMGLYRAHSGGFWSGASRAQQLEGLIEFYETINQHLNFKYKDIIDPRLYRYYRELQGSRLEKILASMPARVSIKRIRRIARRVLPTLVRRWIRALFWRLKYRRPSRARFDRVRRAAPIGRRRWP